MFCITCGKEIPDDSVFCPNCGDGIEKNNENPDLSVKSGKKKKIIQISGICIIILIVICAALFTSQPFQSYLSENKEKKFQKDSRDLAEQACNTILQGTQSLSVDVDCSSQTQVRYEGTAMKGDFTNSAKIDFIDNKVHLTGDTIIRQYSGASGTGDDIKTEVYIPESSTPVIWQNIDDTGFNKLDAVRDDCISMDEYLGFVDLIKQDIKDAKIHKPDNTETIVLEGSISGNEICKSYIRILKMTGNEPEYMLAEEIPYSITISVKEKVVKTIRFDMEEIAKYTWYGNWNDGLEFDKVTGDFEITYESVNKTNDFEIPAELSNNNGRNHETVTKDWKQVYLDYFNTYEFQDKYHSQMMLDVFFIDMNLDEIPEIFLLGGSTADGISVFSIKKDEKVSEKKFKSAAVSYIPEENKILMSGGRMDNYFDTVVSANSNGDIEEVHTGIWVNDFSQNNDAPVTTYSWDGKNTSEDEYKNALADTYDINKSINLQGENGNGKLENIINIIEEY